MGICNDVIIAKNGQEGLDCLASLIKSNCCPELLIMDLFMPLMDGEEFLKEFRNSYYCNYPIFLTTLTNSTNPKDIILARQMGVELYLNKPLTDYKLKLIINSFGISTI